MRPVIALLPFVLGTLLAAGGCDRAGPGNGQAVERPAANAAVPGPQPDEVAPDGAAPAAAPDNGVDEIGTLDRSHAGEAAPAIQFQNAERQLVSLANFRGRPVLLNLWATWCAPCVTEMPTLDRLAERSGYRLEVVTVSQDLDGAAKVDPYFQRANFRRLQPYLDPQFRLGTHYRANLLTTILYDSGGREVWRMFGGMDWTSPTARTLIDEAR